MNVLSLFSGIGGLELGLERAGMTVVGQVELDEFCRSVLAKHWPEVPRHDDVRTAVEWWGSEPRPPVHVVAGGPPCQPASRAGLRLGDADPRWEWPWLLDVVRAVEPRYVVVENPPALLDLHGGVPFGGILGELAALGFDAEWSVLSACSLGAPHTRERLFLVAHATGERLADGRSADVPQEASWVDVAELNYRCWWAAEPDVGRVAHGVSARVDRLRALGNAVVSQAAEHIGRLIVAADRSEVDS